MVNKVAQYASISKEGLWSNNVALVQILGLCPLLAVSSTVINGLGLGLATLLTLVLSNVIVSAFRHHIKPEIRIPIFVLIIASIVTAIELAMNAFFYDLFKVLGIFIPLIVTNCAIIARAEAFASKNPVMPSLIDGLMMGLGFTFILVLLGGMREVLGQGTLMSHAHLMFGDAARWMIVTVIEDYRGFLLAMLPPGAFIGLGLIIAVRNMLHERANKKRVPQILSQTAAST